MTLYILSLIGSGVGFMTQILVSGYWTTAFSQDVFYFSINLATYFLALGFGSLLSSQVKKPSTRKLGRIILGLALVCGLAVPTLRIGIQYFGNAIFFPQLIVILAGALNGMVIPITLKLGENLKRISLGLLFFIDYSAATIFALLFTFVLLIPLGYSKTALILAASSGLVVGSILFFRRELKALEIAATLGTLVVPSIAFFITGAHEAPKVDRSGLAKIIYSEQSHYQKIVLTEENRPRNTGESELEHILYLDGFVQFSSDTEQNYHLCLADIPWVAASFRNKFPSRVLILGGGDGLAARNFLKNNSLKSVTLVELDPAMINLGTLHPLMRDYNKGSLSNPKVEVIVADAFRWVHENQETLRGRFDVIVVDFPAPKNLTLARLFSAEFYRSTFALLSPTGFISIQAGPSHSHGDPKGMTLSKVTSSILKTLESLNYYAFPYITTIDQEAFVLATKDKGFDMEGFSRKIGIYSGGAMSFFCKYDKAWVRPNVEINTLNTLKLSRYMLDWFKNAGDSFFFYRGNSLVFLPE